MPKCRSADNKVLALSGSIGFDGHYVTLLASVVGLSLAMGLHARCCLLVPFGSLALENVVSVYCKSWSHASCKVRRWGPGGRRYIHHLYTVVGGCNYAADCSIVGYREEQRSRAGDRHTLVAPMDVCGAVVVQVIDLLGLCCMLVCWRPMRGC